MELSYQQSVCSLLFGLPARYALHRQISLGCRAHGPVSYTHLTLPTIASFEEGEEKGIAKGITEGMRKIILNMKQAGMDLATIAKTAGLPEKEVEALLK